jgi:SAM-dependent methyltransferase
MRNNLLDLIQATYHGIIPEEARLFLYTHSPEFVQKQFDELSGRIQERPFSPSDLKLPNQPIGPSRFPRRINKLCDETDWFGEEWLGLLDDLGESHCRTRKHRKAWEWAQGVYALQHLNLLRQDATGIGVGAGVESVLFYMANQIKMVYATDIYGEGTFAEVTAHADMMTDPARYAWIPFRQDHLTVLHMDGLNLEFPDNHFDFAFSFSSIEHFGGHAAAARSVREMGRVIKPGGVVVLTTEVTLNGQTHEEFFLPAEIQQFLIDATGLLPIEDIDYTISAQTLANVVDFDAPDLTTRVPHIVLKKDNVCWTSICLVLQKPES